MKPGNIIYIESEDGVNVQWDIVDGDTVVFPGLITPEANFEAESKAVVDSYIRDTIPAEGA